MPCLTSGTLEPIWMDRGVWGGPSTTEVEIGRSGVRPHRFHRTRSWLLPYARPGFMLSGGHWTTTQMRPAASQIAVFTAAALLFPALSVAASRPSRAELTQFVDSLARASLAEPIAGMSIAVVRGSDELVAKGYGYADLENQVPATEHTVYRIGSLTKQFTAAAILQLAEQKKLSLDDEIGRYVPGYDTHGSRITIRQLLSHTSGIPSFTGIAAFQARERLDLSPDSMLALFQHQPLDFPPGTEFLYSNSGYYLLGLIIERVSGQPYGEYLRERIFKPLGLSETFICDDAPIFPRRARGYQVEAWKLENADYISMRPPSSAGCLCSTVRDLATWTRALAEGRVISLASYAQMTTPTKVTDGRTFGYGYGLGLGELAGHPAIVHEGGINGFVSFKELYPRDSLIIIVLCNTESPSVSSGQQSRSIARRALSVPREKVKALPIDSKERARVEGTYGRGRLEVTVSVER